MMFQRKIKEFCQEFHDMIGKNRIKECFLADTDFHSESCHEAHKMPIRFYL